MAEKKLKKSNEKDEDGNLYQDQSETVSRKLSSSPIFPYTLPDDIDVVWNWYSPTSQPHHFRPKVKIQQSPKLLVKRHPSREQITAFNKLVEELKTLTDPRATPNNDKPKFETSINVEDNKYMDVFNDSLDEQLITISQKVEKTVAQPNADGNNITLKSSNVMGNDSFDCLLETIKDEDLSLENRKQTSGKDESPSKCSPEEIEQKRLEALARREAKKMQYNIERNRQEALKRLALTRKRKILQ